MCDQEKRDYQKIVKSYWTYRQMPDKVISMGRYTFQGDTIRCIDRYLQHLFLCQTECSVTFAKVIVTNIHGQSHITKIYRIF